MKKTLTIAALAIGFLAGATALSVLADTGGTWTPPTTPPPGGNVAAPINTSSVNQQKNGWLALVGGLVTANLQVATGTPTAGAILTAIDSAGDATWQSPSSPVECDSDGYMYAIPNGAMDDWGASGDRLEFYCRNHVVRLCLASDSSCSWRTNIAGDDSHTCDYSAGALSTGIGPNTLTEWASAPPSLCSGEAPCTDKSAFNTNGTVMAYGRGKNTWYLCSAAHQKTIITTM